MENETHIDYSIEDLQVLIDAARRLHSENPKSTKPIIRFTKKDGVDRTTANLLSIEEN